MAEVTIRPAVPDDLPRLVEVSLAADTLFAEAGVRLPPDDPEPVLAAATWLLVAEPPDASDLVVGFAQLGELDGLAHLEQLGVHPDHGRRGVGGALVAAACADARRRGYPAMTLTTFRDLAFNAPWYARRGFAVLPEPEWGPQLAAQWRREADAGLLVAPRVVMRKALERDAP